MRCKKTLIKYLITIIIEKVYKYCEAKGFMTYILIGYKYESREKVKKIQTYLLNIYIKIFWFPKLKQEKDTEIILIFIL